MKISVEWTGWWPALALVLAGALCSAATGGPGTKAVSPATVEDLISKGDYEQACTLICDGALTGVSSDLCNRAGMGLHCGNCRQIKLALGCLEKAVAMEPKSIYLRFNLGVTYWNGGYIPEARRECQKVLEQDPGNVQALQILQRIRKGDFHKELHRSQVKQRTVVFSLSADRSLSPRIAGSWNGQGKNDQLDGWNPVPMVAGPMSGNKTVFRHEVVLQADTGNWYSVVVYGGTAASAGGRAGGEPSFFRRFPVYPIGSAPLKIALDDHPIQKPPAFLRPRRCLVPPAAPADCPRTLLVCIDSDTWQIVMPLVKAGFMPRLAELMENGSHGEILSDPPISALVFDRLNHGKAGTFGWFDPAKDTVETLKERGLDLIHAGDLAGTENTWKFLARNGHPAVYISWAERLFYDTDGSESRETVHARAAVATQDGVTVPARAVKVWSILDHREVPRPGKITSSDAVGEELVDAGLTRFREAMEILRKRRPRVAFVHFGFIDTSFHLFWDAMDPDLAFLTPGFKAPRRHSRVIENLHRLLDLFIGAFAAESWEKGGNLVVFSDHGAIGGFARSWLGHVPRGMLVAAGPAFARGRRITPPPDISSVVPTLCTIHGVELPPIYPGQPLPCLVGSSGGRGTDPSRPPGRSAPR